MKLTELLNGWVDKFSKSEATIEVKGLALNSNKVKPGYLFVALSGTSQHGLNYLQQALNNGAIATVYETLGSESFALQQTGICLLAVPDLAQKLGCIADRFYKSPSKVLDVIGITGTNGKTSCSQFLLQMLTKSAVIGTLGWGDNNTIKDTVNTTPDAIATQEILSCFVNLQKQMVILEASSHGLRQGRVNGINFKAAIFMNLQPEHLDYHLSMDNYLQAKLLLFKKPKLQFVVVNTDDTNSVRFLAVVKQNTKCWAFSAMGNTTALAQNVIAVEIETSLQGCSFLVCWGEQSFRVNSGIVGEFNIENILASITVLLALGYALDNIVNKANKLLPITGRMEKFGGDGKPFVFVDYAHTPDALKKALVSLKPHCIGKLWLVFGCGGNRYYKKRAQMGAIAEKYADQVIITNDNPRFEQPSQIIQDIEAGCVSHKHKIIANRELAIQTAINKAHKQDCILIAGKGHEAYQDIKGVRQKCNSDQMLVKQTLVSY